MSLSKEVNKLFDEIEYKISKLQKRLVERKELSPPPKKS